MAKAGTKPKRKPKPTTSDKEQSERFMETARTLGVEETGKVFKEAFERIVPAKERPMAGRSPKK